MNRSTDRILTTHTGSLPRPMDLAAMLEEFDSGELPDRGKFESRVREAVAEVVKIQVEAGVDVVSDGEQGKVGYSTYVRHRLTGFEGEGSVTARSDWADFPEAIARLPRPSTVSRPACIRGRTRQSSARRHGGRSSPRRVLAASSSGTSF